MFIVVPSTVYNNRIFDIFKKVADKVESAQAGKNRQLVGSEYEITLTNDGFSDGLNPFTSYSDTIERVFSYKGDFSSFRPDTPFWGIPQKQFFVSEEDMEAHFQQIEEEVFKRVSPDEDTEEKEGE